MLRLSPLVALSILSTVFMTDAQCVDPGFVLCLPDGSQLGGVPTSDFDDTNFWFSLESSAGTPIIGRRDLANRLAARQDALCCSPNPDVQCLLLIDENIPFCYNQETTRYFFSDESFGYISNGTYYAADGTFVDFDKGYYSSTDGSTGTFAPATAAPTATQSGGTATVTHATSTKTANGGGGTASPESKTDSSNGAVGVVEAGQVHVVGFALTAIVIVWGSFNLL